MRNIKYSILPLLLVLYVNCATHSPRTELVKKTITKEFLVIGHRGTGDNSVAPENTLSAFRFALKNNSAFELDTMFSKSGELVVIHDSDVDRTTNGKGMVDQLSLAELKALDAGKLNPKFKGEKIPTLNEVMDEFKGKTIIDIEIKSQAAGPEAKKIGEAVAKLIQSKQMEGHVFVTSFNPLVLAKIKEVNPNVIRGQLYSDFSDVPQLNFFVKYMLRNLKLNFKAEPDILAPNFRLVDKDYVEKYHEYGYKIYPWTVNDEKEMERLILLGVDGIITDRADIANSIYESLKKSGKIK
jgi:glycerophosphoryl diester phosphodiesterase